MEISKNGINLIKSFESLQLTSYRDTGGVWTIGWGHTDGVKEGMKITEQEAERLLAIDLTWTVLAVDRGVKVKINQNQFDALVSFTFNCGAGSLKNILENLNAGEFDKVPPRMRLYVHDVKKVKQPGLIRRRKEETELFIKQDNIQTSSQTN